jgi:hypothetical protein
MGSALPFTSSCPPDLRPYVTSDARTSNRHVASAITGSTMSSAPGPMTGAPICDSSCTPNSTRVWTWVLAHLLEHTDPLVSLVMSGTELAGRRCRH